MTLKKHGLGLAGLLIAAVLSMMGLATSAQAATPGVLINGKPAGNLKATMGAEQVGAGYILVAALNLEIKCEGFTVQEGTANGADASGRLLLEGCAPFSITKLEPLPCKIIVSGIDSRPHISAIALFLPAEILTTEAPAFLAEQMKALILFKSGTGCPFALDNVVTGELCFAIDNNDTVEPLILSNSTIQGTCRPRNVLEGTEQSSGGVKDKLFFGAQTATIDVTAHLFLEGEHEGMTFGVSLF